MSSPVYSTIYQCEALFLWEPNKHIYDFFSLANLNLKYAKYVRARNESIPAHYDVISKFDCHSQANSWGQLPSLWKAKQNLCWIQEWGSSPDQASYNQIILHTVRTWLTPSDYCLFQNPKSQPAAAAIQTMNDLKLQQ